MWMFFSRIEEFFMECSGMAHALGTTDLFVTPAKAGVQVIDLTGFRLSPE
jgi:hypothetical protein